MGYPLILRWRSFNVLPSTCTSGKGYSVFFFRIYYHCIWYPKRYWAFRTVTSALHSLENLIADLRIVSFRSYLRTCRRCVNQRGVLPVFLSYTANRLQRNLSQKRKHSAFASITGCTRPCRKWTSQPTTCPHHSCDSGPFLPRSYDLCIFVKSISLLHLQFSLIARLYNGRLRAKSSTFFIFFDNDIWIRPFSRIWLKASRFSDKRPSISFILSTIVTRAS